MKKRENSKLSNFRDSEIKKDQQGKMKGGFLLAAVIDYTRCEIERSMGWLFGGRNGDGDW